MRYKERIIEHNLHKPREYHTDSLKLQEVDFDSSVISHHPKSFEYYFTHGLVVNDRRYIVKEFFVKHGKLYAILTEDEDTYYEMYLSFLDENVIEDLKKDIADLKAKDKQFDKRLSELENARKQNQTLSINDRTISISNGNSIELPADKDTVYDDTALKKRVKDLEDKPATPTGVNIFFAKGDISGNGNAQGVKVTKDRLVNADTIKVGDIVIDSYWDKTNFNIGMFKVDSVNGNEVVLNGVNDIIYKQPKQSLTLSDRTLSISEGNSVTLPNDKQTISKQGNKLVLSNGGGEVELQSQYDDSELRSKISTLESKPDNDKQKLSINDHTLTISDGNSIVIPNDIQNLNITDNILTISSGNAVTLPKYDDTDVNKRLSALELKSDKDTIYDDTDLRNEVNALKNKTDRDEQQLNLDRKVLSITNGNNVTLPDGNTRDITLDNLVTQPENRILEAYKTPISVLTGKKILFVGDSLTEINYRTSRGYVESLKADKGIEAINNGTSGFGYSTKDESFMGADRDSCDAFVIFLGINDFGNVSGFKLPLDIVLKTAKRLISKACLQAGNRPIGVILPMQNLNTLNDKLGAGGYSLKQLVDGIKSTVKEVGTQFNRAIPVLDLYTLDPLDVTKYSLNTTEGTKYLTNYFTQNMTEDTEFLHPNDAGWKIITPYISYWLENTFNFQGKRPDTKTLQVIERSDGKLEINTTTTPIKYDDTESNSYNRGKFRIPTFGDGSNIYNLRGRYSDDKTKYKLVFTIDDFTFDTDYHPVATEYYQQFFYFDVDSISTNPTEYLENNNVKTIMNARSCDEKEAKYILSLMRLYKKYLDSKLFTSEEQSSYQLLNTSSVPFPMKVVIEKR